MDALAAASPAGRAGIRGVLRGGLLRPARRSIRCRLEAHVHIRPVMRHSLSGQYPALDPRKMDCELRLILAGIPDERTGGDAAPRAGWLRNLAWAELRGLGPPDGHV